MDLWLPLAYQASLYSVTFPPYGVSSCLNESDSSAIFESCVSLTATPFQLCHMLSHKNISYLRSNKWGGHGAYVGRPWGLCGEAMGLMWGGHGAYVGRPWGLYIFSCVMSYMCPSFLD